MLAALAAGLAASACGGTGVVGEDLPHQEATLVLDRPPEAVQAGIYLAAERGFDRGEGVTLRMRRRAGASARRSLSAGRADAAILGLHELAAAQGDDDRDLVAVMALVQRPLKAIFVRPPLDSPADLAGKRVAVDDAAGDRALLAAMVRADGGDAREATITEAGAGGLRALEAGRVAAVVADRTTPGLGAGGLRELRPEDFGAPAYPELVLTVTRGTLDERPGTVRAIIRALQRGYREAQIDPESAATVLLEQGARGDREALLAQLDAIAPAWTAGAQVYGELRPDVLREWAKWIATPGERPLELDERFETGLVTRQPAP
jgi:ABC-type nitrate/sulfonate/bicarbonate transport system substrate-binding protein